MPVATEGTAMLRLIYAWRMRIQLKVESRSTAARVSTPSPQRTIRAMRSSAPVTTRNGAARPAQSDRSDIYSRSPAREMGGPSG